MAGYNVTAMLETIRKVAQTTGPEIVEEDLGEYIGARANLRLQVTKEQRKVDHWIGDYEGNGR